MVNKISAISILFSFLLGILLKILVRKKSSQPFYLVIRSYSWISHEQQISLSVSGENDRSFPIPLTLFHSPYAFAINTINNVNETIYYVDIFPVCRAQTESSPSALVFTADMNQQVISETTQTGTVVYTLRASPSGGATDPVKSDESGGLSNNVTSNRSLRFFIRGTEAFVVNEATGDVTLSQPLDREVCELWIHNQCQKINIANNINNDS